MRILYFCNVHRLIPTESGVIKKVLAQCNVLSESGHEVLLACPDDNSGVYRIIDKNGFSLTTIGDSYNKQKLKESQLLNYLFEYIMDHHIAAIYSRYSNYSVALSSFYNRLRRKHVRVLLEVPTYPISQRWTSVRQNLKARNYIKALKQVYNSTIGSLGILFFRKSVDRIVNNNGFDSIWGVPTLKISNGVDVSSIPPKSDNMEKEKSEVNIIAVANVAHWHGYDRIIRGLSEYYKEFKQTKVYFNIVGPGEEIVHLKELTNRLKLQNYVSFKGVLTGQDLDNAFNAADIGISVLGAHRNKMKRYDSLKSREYCARCLPFVTEDLEYQYSDCPFVLCVHSDESSIDIMSILSFYSNVSSMQDLRSIMRNYAINKCDWRVAFIPVVDYLRSE